MLAPVIQQEMVTALSKRIKRRNRQIRRMRLALKELVDFLADARLEPPLPVHLQKWLEAEVKKL